MNPDTLPAVVDCLIPPDDFPGAYDAGVCDYIEQLIQTDLADHAESFRAGIDAIDIEALATYNAPFAALTREQQMSILEGIESGTVKTSWPVAPSRFFEMLVNITAEGYYSDPQQGGNRGCVSWVMTGFEDHIDWLCPSD
jgi:gluconate 2-dehydrogenase gamma chain